MKLRTIDNSDLNSKNYPKSKHEPFPYSNTTKIHN